MDQTVKERLVGMGVLLILGVIFIPLILDGNNSELEGKSNQNLSLPVPTEEVTHELDFSDGNLRTLAIPLPDSNETQSSPKETSSDAAKQVKPNSIPVSGFVDELPEIKTDEADLKNDTNQPQSTTLTAATEPKGSINRVVPKANTSVVTPKADSGLQTATVLQSKSANSGSPAWVVQIGSFGDRKNAEKEVASLKAKGFPAFVRRFVASEDKVLYRVRIGPEKDRARAEKLFERLSKAGIKGQIVPDP